MYPNDPLQPQPTGIDYLQQIAPPPPPAGLGRRTRLLLVGLGVLLLLSLVLIILTPNRSATIGSPDRIAARLVKLQKVAERYQSRLRSSALQDANSSLIAVLTTANASAAATLLPQADAKQREASFASLDPIDPLDKKLSEAALNASLDETYLREMRFQIKEAVTHMETLAKKTRSSEQRAFLDKAVSDLSNIHKQLSALSGD